MSRHSGPHFTVPPDDQRCEAMVRGIPSYNFEWQRLDHRCPRRANQTRGLPFSVETIAVCHAHARSKTIEPFQRRASMADEPIPSPKNKVGTVDMTPHWIEILPLLLEAHADEENYERHSAALTELERMARAADGYNQLQSMVSDGMQKIGAALYELRDRARIPRSQEKKDGE